MATWGREPEPWPAHWEVPPRSREESVELAREIWADQVVLRAGSPIEAARKLVHDREDLGALFDEALMRVARAYKAHHSEQHQTQFRLAVQLALMEPYWAQRPFGVGWLPGED